MRAISAPADDYALHARVWASERTQHITWELPAEPRFRVARGGLREDWKWARQVAANMTFLSLLLLTLVFWPHTRPRPAAFMPPAVPAQLFAPTGSTIPPAAYRATTATRQPPAYSRANARPGYSYRYQPLRIRPSLYADHWVRRDTPVRLTIPFHATSYRVAPSAPIASSIPPLQSPY